MRDDRFAEIKLNFARVQETGVVAVEAEPMSCAHHEGQNTALDHAVTTGRVLVGRMREVMAGREDVVLPRPVDAQAGRRLKGFFDLSELGSCRTAAGRRNEAGQDANGEQFLHVGRIHLV